MGPAGRCSAKGGESPAVEIPLVSRPHHRFDLFEAMGETGFCDTANLRKLGEAGIGVGKAKIAG